PNPVTEEGYQLGLNFSSKRPVTISVYNTSGQLISQLSIENALNQLLTFNRPSIPGLYFINVAGEGINQTQRVIIR
ncbi:MAG: T9SS type A sorting domain-containing protein, partial [Bacteroidota bacterium]